GSCRQKEQNAHGAEPNEGLNDQSDDHGAPRARPIGLYFGLYLTVPYHRSRGQNCVNDGPWKKELPLRRSGAFAGRFRNARFWRNRRVPPTSIAAHRRVARELSPSMVYSGPGED